MLNTCAQLFVDDLESKNLNYQSGTSKQGDSVVDFPYEGKIAKMVFSGDKGEYFSLYIVYDHVHEDKVAEVIYACKEFNAEYKWVTAYVDSDNDLMFHEDALLSESNAADEAFELLVRALKIMGEVKPKFMRAIYA